MTRVTISFVLWLAACIIADGQAARAADSSGDSDGSAGLEFIQVANDGRHFVLAESKARFTPWGLNYDHDRTERLLEYYWKDEWSRVAADFAEMKRLGANTVRIHLQVSRFMNSATEPNRESLALLARLVALAETNGLYLDLTGLACYDKPDVPKWYNDLDEAERWDVQARYWEAIAKTCARSPAIFCYDLMNEPVVSEDKTNRDWTPGAFADRYYVQRLTLDFKGRTPPEIAKAWVDKMVITIRRQDNRHMITVGEIPWALTWPGAKSVFHSNVVGTNLDFVSVHFYPRKGEVDKALTALKVYQVGKPVVIEEMFPLHCSMAELARFIDGSRTNAAGWIGFYWGETIEEYRQAKSKGTGKITDAATPDWLEYFAKKSPEMLRK